MTRRDFLWMTAAATKGPSAAERVVVPIHRVVDVRARVPADSLRRFWGRIWPEAYGEFSRGGIDLETEDAAGEVKRSAADRPILVGLRRDMLNLVLTDYIPMFWDRGRSVAGVSTVYDGYPLCMVAMLYAHGNQVPYLSTNTCVHELLHALLGDILERHPKWYQVSERESRTDWYATQLWLFGDGAAVRRSARIYLRRLGASRTAS
jgi:hypothetical protein